MRVLIADDERMARRRMRRLLEAIGELDVVAECESGDEALSALNGDAIDVAILDIQMPGLSGLDVSRLAAERGVPIIFATAHPEHAAEAFDQGVVDYVRKPIDAGRLSLAIERLRDRLARSPEASPSLERIAFTVRGEVRLVSPDDISHATLDGALVTVWARGEALVTELSLQEIERRLPGGRFERVHRRALLNLERVDRLRPLESGGYVALTEAGHEVPVSRKAARALRKRLGIG